MMATVNAFTLSVLIPFRPLFNYRVTVSANSRYLDLRQNLRSTMAEQL